LSSLLLKLVLRLTDKAPRLRVKQNRTDTSSQ
jgi:hypothetical protein